MVIGATLVGGGPLYEVGAIVSRKIPIPRSFFFFKPALTYCGQAVSTEYSTGPRGLPTPSAHSPSLQLRLTAEKAPVSGRG